MLPGNLNSVGIADQQPRISGSTGQNGMGMHSQSLADVSQAADGCRSYHLIGGSQFHGIGFRINLAVNGGCEKEISKTLGTVKGYGKPAIGKKNSKQCLQKVKQLLRNYNRVGSGILKKLFLIFRRANEAVVEQGMKGGGQVAGRRRIQTKGILQLSQLDGREENMPKIAKGDQGQIFEKFTG